MNATFSLSNHKSSQFTKVSENFLNFSNSSSHQDYDRVKIPQSSITKLSHMVTQNITTNQKGSSLRKKEIPVKPIHYRYSDSAVQNYLSKDQKLAAMKKNQKKLSFNNKVKLTVGSKQSSQKTIINSTNFQSAINSDGILSQQNQTPVEFSTSANQTIVFGQNQVPSSFYIRSNDVSNPLSKRDSSLVSRRYSNNNNDLQSVNEATSCKKNRRSNSEGYTGTSEKQQLKNSMFHKRKNSIQKNVDKYLGNLKSKVQQVLQSNILQEKNIQEVSQNKQIQTFKRRQLSRLDQTKLELQDSLIESRLNRSIFRSNDDEFNDSKQELFKERPKSAFLQSVNFFSGKVEEIIKEQMKQKRVKIEEKNQPFSRPCWSRGHKVAKVQQAKEKLVNDMKKKVQKQLGSNQKKRQTRNNFSLRKPKVNTNKENKSGKKAQQFMTQVVPHKGSILRSRRQSRQDQPTKRKSSLIDMIYNYESSSSSERSPTQDLPAWAKGNLFDKVRKIRL